MPYYLQMPLENESYLSTDPPFLLWCSVYSSHTYITKTCSHTFIHMYVATTEASQCRNYNTMSEYSPTHPEAMMAKPSQHQFNCNTYISVDIWCKWS